MRGDEVWKGGGAVGFLQRALYVSPCRLERGTQAAAGSKLGSLSHPARPPIFSFTPISFNAYPPLLAPRCQIEAGTAFCFHLLESRPAAGAWQLLGSSRPHRYSLTAPSVDDACEWVVAIRDAIAVATGRALQYEES